MTDHPDRWCPQHGLHGLWSEGRCRANVCLGIECQRMPVAPHVVESIKDEARRQALEDAADYLDERGMGYINASSRPENSHASVRLHKAGMVLREQADHVRGLATQDPQPKDDSENA